MYIRRYVDFIASVSIHSKMFVSEVIKWKGTLTVSNSYIMHQ